MPIIPVIYQVCDEIKLTTIRAPPMRALERPILCTYSPVMNEDKMKETA
jgi:hypothetical protein